MAGYDLCTGWGTPTLNLINALALPGKVAFTGAPTNGAAPLTVSFTNLSGGASSYSWSFGNGQTSTNANPPAITYTNAGAYTVSLTAVTPGGASTLTLTNYILVSAVPPASDLLLAGAMLLPGGGFRFAIAKADGTPVTADQQLRMEVYMASDIASALASWTQLTNATSLTNNLLEVTDPETGLGQRFYRAVQRP